MQRLPRSYFIIALFIALIGIQTWAATAPAVAQFAPVANNGASQGPTGAPGWDTLKVDERRALLSRLSDEQVREILVGQLDRSARAETVQRDGSLMVGGIQAEAHVIRENLGKLLARIGDLPSALTLVYKNFTEGRSPWHVFYVLTGMTVMFTVGYIAERLFRRWTQPARRRFEQATPQQLGGKLGYLGLRIVLDLVAVGVFAVMTIATFFIFYQGHEPSRLMVTTYVSVVLIVRLASVVSTFLIAPGAPHVRMVPFDDADARYYHRCVIWFVGFVSFGILTGSFLSLLGLADDLHLLLTMFAALASTVMLCVMIWHGRNGIAALIRGGVAEGRVTRQVKEFLAETWHLLAIAYVVGVIGLTFVRRIAGEDTSAGVALGSIMIVLAVVLLDAAIGRLMNDFVRARQAANADAAGGANYIPAVRRGVRIMLVLVGVVVFAGLWGLNLFSMADQSLGATMTRTILDVGITVLIAYVGWQIAKTAIDKHLAAEDGEAEVERGAEGGGTGASRVRTLLPLLRRFLQILISVMVSMIVLSSLGVDIGPLIAGAGIFGLAIGFGAQTLVRDIVSGVFFLLDDAFRVGEYVDIGDVKGTVEKITVRSLVLRHHLGPLHTVPFGEIKYLSNYSRDWVIMKLQFRVTYDTDINRVKKIFKKIGADLLQDEVLGPGFIEPFKSQGVKAMEDSAIIVRGKFMAKPGEQFMIRKEIYRRVQEGFKEAGIEFAHRRVTVDLPANIDPASDQGKAVGDAAAAAIMEQEKSPA